MALIETESSFIPSNLSKEGAMGLGQIMKVHVPILIGENIIKEKRDLFDIAPNIQATSFIFQSLYKKHEYNLRKTMASYLGEHNKKYFESIIRNYFELMALITQVRENK
jgi:soluble lytic murein transglycosylase-like protein